VTRDEDEQPATGAAHAADRAVSALLGRGGASALGARDDRERDLIRLWNEMDGLGRSPAYDALLGDPTWRERLVAFRNSLSWRIALPLVPAGAAAAFAAYLLMPVSTHVDYAAGAQAREVTLPDQSVVALAPESQVDFEMVDGKRVATLTGEARFSVAHDSARPFLVKVGDAQVRVVGTQFTLSHRTACTQLSVISGTVDITSPSMPPRRLNAGEETVTVDNGRSYRICEGATPGAAPLRWSYVDVPLSTVIADAGRFSPRKIVVRAPEIAAERVTMAFRGEEIETILDLIPEIVNAQVERGSDGTVYIDRRR